VIGRNLLESISLCVSKEIKPHRAGIAARQRPGTCKGKCSQQVVRLWELYYLQHVACLMLRAHCRQLYPLKYFMYMHTVWIMKPGVTC